MLTSSLTLRLEIELIANDCWASGLGWERAVSPVRSNFCFWDSAGASSTTDFRREAAACETDREIAFGSKRPTASSALTGAWVTSSSFHSTGFSG